MTTIHLRAKVIHMALIGIVLFSVLTPTAALANPSIVQSNLVDSPAGSGQGTKSSLAFGILGSTFPKKTAPLRHPFAGARPGGNGTFEIAGLVRQLHCLTICYSATVAQTYVQTLKVFETFRVFLFNWRLLAVGSLVLAVRTCEDGATKETAMNKKYAKPLFAIIITLSGLWFFRNQFAGMWSWFGSFDAVTASMRQAGMWGPATIAVLFILQVFLAFIPGQALMVACGYLYGFWGGFFLSWLSLVAGGELAYILARKQGRPFAEQWISPEVLSRWDESARGQGIGFFFVMLVMPLVPNDAMCYVAGLGTISHRRFAIANLLGRGMACMITSAAGALGGNLSMQGWAVIIGVFFIVGIAWQIARYRNSNVLIA